MYGAYLFLLKKLKKVAGAFFVFLSYVINCRKKYRMIEAMVVDLYGKIPLPSLDNFTSSVGRPSSSIKVRFRVCRSILETLIDILGARDQENTLESLRTFHRTGLITLHTANNQVFWPFHDLPTEAQATTCHGLAITWIHGHEFLENFFVFKDQSSIRKNPKNKIFEKIMKNGAFLVFTTTSESL
jgi:hypothetical protein